jgi:hypothetical protein
MFDSGVEHIRIEELKNDRSNLFVDFRLNENRLPGRGSTKKR